MTLNVGQRFHYFIRISLIRELCNLYYTMYYSHNQYLIRISLIREGLPFLVELTPEGGENRVARLQLSVTEVFLSFCISAFVILYFNLPHAIVFLGMIFQMFGLIFQTQVSNFCLTSRRTGELVLARTRQHLISTLHHRPQISSSSTSSPGWK